MSAPLELLQSQFAAGILGTEREILRALRAEHGLDAAQRFAIYRDAYRARLADALADTFGHTARFLGEDAFRELALDYVETHAPSAYSIRWYGASFPRWLRRVRPQAGALSELAALDWALRAAFDSADAVPLDAAVLAALKPEDWNRVGFRLHPSFRLLAQHWNTVAIWQALNSEETPPAARPLPQPATLSVWRRALQPHFRTLDEGEADALRALRAGAPFAALCARLAAAGAQDDAVQRAGRWLRRWVEEQLLVALR